MSRVLLVCPEPLGHGQPAGNGIRFTEMARVLLADGHSVIALSPDGGTIDGTEAAALVPENILRESQRADVAVVQGHAANDFFAHAHPVPTVIDLYDPYIIENLHYYADRGAEVFTHDHATVMRSLAQGDLFLCASEAQRMFWLGTLLAIGRLNPILFEDDPHLDSLVRIAPFGVPPARPAVPRNVDTPAILFGGIYDWYDPIVAIDAVAIARRTLPGITLTFTRHPNPELTPQGKIAAAMEHVRRKGYGDFVSFEPWAPYGRRAEFFERFTAALLTFPQSLETDLSMRTRVYDYLWCGLPIVTSSAPGTDEVLTRYGAGIVVPGEDPEQYAAALVALAEGYEERVQGTRAFVDEHQWAKALAPLRDFCNDPAFEKTKELFTATLHVPERPPSLLDRIRRRLRA